MSERVHQGEAYLHAGAPLAEARAALLMVHGRGASARDILTVRPEVARPAVAYLAPQAADNSWYPQSFLAPLEQNEPWLASALARLETLLEEVGAGGVPPERVMLLGFSQGACLVLEYVARHARRYGAVAGLSGGLIGPPGTPRRYEGSLAGTPIFLGSSDPDPHIPTERVHESDKVLAKLGATVTTRLYPRMGHTINEDELAHVRALLAQLAP